MIIEDDADLAEIFTQALQAAKFTTETIRAGQDALDRLAVVTPDVVVLDLHLPQVSGEEIYKRIRSDQRLVNTRVILASADALRAEYLRGKADLVLIKPISMAQLRDLAARIYEKKRTS
jgi:DNA-binding response OmpR family regulator